MPGLQPGSLDEELQQSELDRSLPCPSVRRTDTLDSSCNSFASAHLRVPETARTEERAKLSSRAL